MILLKKFDPKAIVLILLILGSVYATCDNDGICESGEEVGCGDCPQLLSRWTDWIITLSIVLSISFGILGIGFMLSKVFGVPAWESLVREEFGNLIFTVFLLFLVLGLLATIEQLTSSIADEMISTAGGEVWSYNQNTGRWISGNSVCTFPCQFYLARAFLGKLYEDYAKSAKEVGKYYAVSYYEESTSVSTDFVMQVERQDEKGSNVLGGIVLSFGWPRWAYKAIYNRTIARILDLILGAMQSIKIQEFILLYLQHLSPMLIFLGLIVRNIPQLRPLGGLLFSLGLGIYVFLPMVYVLGWYVVKSVKMDLEISGGLGFGNMYSYHELEPDPDMFFTKWTDGSVEKYGLLDLTSRIYIPKLLIPIIAIFTTIGFVRHFSPMIGGDPEIAGLSRLI